MFIGIKLDVSQEDFDACLWGGDSNAWAEVFIEVEWETAVISILLVAETWDWLYFRG